MKDVFEFNHIDRTLSESDIKTLKDFYSHYHKKYWCFKRSYKRYKLLDETLTLSGGGLVVIGTMTGGITLNPIILGVINGAGVLVASISKMKNYKKKMEMTQIAFTTYEKVLVELRSALRGDEFKKQDFIDRMKLMKLKLDVFLNSMYNVIMFFQCFFIKECSCAIFTRNTNTSDIFM